MSILCLNYRTLCMQFCRNSLIVAMNITNGIVLSSILEHFKLKLSHFIAFPSVVTGDYLNLLKIYG